ncbi:MAG: phosphatidate cytidylyltransferase [Planctomycetes bacterium]|nr:phosphatidate cytidylyltransferase [Planctomycetota bacterium]
MSGEGPGAAAGAPAGADPELPSDIAATRRLGRRELRTRFVFGPLLIALVAVIYWLDSTVLRRAGAGGMLTAGVLGLLGVAGVHEYVVMMRKAGHAVAPRLLPLMTIALLVLPFFFGWRQVDRELYPLVIATLALVFPIALESLARGSMDEGLERQGGTLLGFLTIAWPMYLAQGMAIRHLPSVLYVVVVCKVGDIGAYLVGVAIGRHKLIPHISSGKTIEGAAGSLVASIAAAVLLDPLLIDPEVPLGLTGAIGVGIMLNATTQSGDLIESLLKRRCGVKDSSALLPAHGGVLDLIDSLLFSFPAFLAVLVLLT